MRLDHLLSREEEVGVGLLFKCQGSEDPGGGSPKEGDTERRLAQDIISGGDASGGHTRSHPEHDG